MNVHIYFSIEREEGEPKILSVLCQDTEGNTIAEWADEPSLESLSIIVHKKLPYRLRQWLELPARGPKSNAKSNEDKKTV
jgi:hypothetical protein